jgi:hypothetical protein
VKQGIGVMILHGYLTKVGDIMMLLLQIVEHMTKRNIWLLIVMKIMPKNNYYGQKKI